MLFIPRPYRRYLSQRRKGTKICRQGWAVKNFAIHKKNIRSFFVSNPYFLEVPLIVERPDTF